MQADVNTLCKSNFDCTNNAECIEEQCFCKNGFVAKGSICVDVDECSNSSKCGENAACLNVPGSFKCECSVGYIGSPPKTMCRAPCEDVQCGEHSYCKPDGSDAYCVCEDGWTFDPNDIAAGCIDIDECKDSIGSSGRCGDNAVCLNTLGSFICNCPEGYTGDSRKECVDINECLIENTCGVGAHCINRPGSFTCECPEGTLPDPEPIVKCSEILSCKSDAECPGNAFCDQYKKCLCPEPNIGNECRRKFLIKLLFHKYTSLNQNQTKCLK